MKRKLLMAALFVVSAFGFNAKAQTDVTDTYLTNAGFDTSSDFQTGNIDQKQYGATGWTIKKKSSSYTYGAL